ncbi:hypothetical protein V5F38_03990 [Xanthobacter sp. V0B-10]|uniref:hypothetical protein n=1 Tax=Xanthobacter albus TaxID=3119929 RepID=UPI00372A3A18
MPDLTIVEDGGERRDWDREISQQHFEAFVVALLRSLAAGDGSYRLTQEFFRFLEHAQDSKMPIGPVLDGAIRNLHDQAFDSDSQNGYDTEKKRVLQAALRVTAESMASDNLARARRSKREDELRHAIDEKVLGSERRSRENGWSYLANLTEKLGKWPTRKK